MGPLWRLDNALDEDRSRVRNPNAALVLGMFRRVVVGLAIPWSPEKRKTNKRTSTRNFLEHLNADNRCRAGDLITSKAHPHGKIRKNQPEEKVHHIVISDQSERRGHPLVRSLTGRETTTANTGQNFDSAAILYIPPYI